jgi:hypothetical protein
MVKQTCPAFGTNQLGLAHDPITETVFAGFWDHSIIYLFTVDGTTLRSVNVSLTLPGLVTQSH